MGFNFRKSLKILPGVRLNIGKNGVSGVSAGKRGLRISAGKNGVRASAGVPGTGLSYSKRLDSEPKPKRSISFGKLLLLGIAFLFVLIWVVG